MKDLTRRLEKVERRLGTAEAVEDEADRLDRQARWWRSHGNEDAAISSQPMAAALRSFWERFPEYRDQPPPPDWREILGSD